MPTVNDPDLHYFGEWVFRFRPSSTGSSHLIVLLHGFTGDENSMWVFAPKLPREAAIMAPRGRYVSVEGGYTWRKNRSALIGFPTIEDLCPSSDALIDFIDKWSNSKEMDISRIDLIGFSQGAALAYTLALLYPGRTGRIAALSGFLPRGSEPLVKSQKLTGKQFFIAHGRKDNHIPVEEARKTAELLKDSGADVRYCESSGGHKVSVNCFSEMSDIFK